MRRRVAFAAKNKIGLLHGDRLTYLHSRYLDEYKQKREQIRRQRSWKTQGTWAAFRGDVNPEYLLDLDELVARAAINGLSFAADGRLIYSISVGDASGIFLLDPGAPAGDEGHIIHGANMAFHGLDHSPARDEIAVAVDETVMERHIALLTLEKCRLYFITEGDSFDNNPVWSKAERDVLYYDSAGIGRNKQGVPVCLGPRVINRLDLGTCELTEVVAIKNHDCYQPRVDARDNLFFIKRPYQKPETGPSLWEIPLIPIKILKAVYKWVEFFTIRHTGEPLTTAGANPAKVKQDLRRMLIDGNIINAERSLEENRRHGESFPGIAPRNWELMRREPDGNLVPVKQGVLAFDLTDDGGVVYSNGTYLIHLAPDGTEHQLGKVDCSGVIKVLGEPG